MYQQRVGPRFEHREKAGRRVQAAPCLSARFRHLKSLTVGLAYYDHDGVTKNSQVKYTVNLDHAKTPRPSSSMLGDSARMMTS